MSFSFIISCRKGNEKINDSTNFRFFMFLARLPNLIFKLESWSIKESKTKGQLIFAFSLMLMDMVAFKASFNIQWPFNQFKTQAMTTWNKVFAIIYNICHVRRGGTQPMTLTLVWPTIIANFYFLKLNNFLKHDHIACKPTQIDYPIIRAKFYSEIFSKQ